MTGDSRTRTSERTCRFCGRGGNGYRNEPRDYIAWQEWANEMVKTHHQERCPGCGRYTVWTQGPPEEEHE